MRIEVNRIGFEVSDQGEGPTVVLVHGFPDTSRVWRNQIPALVEAGYRVIAPDMRGFGATDAPEGVDDYAISAMIGDIPGIMDALGVERAHLVGHDFGSALAWATAMFLPDRLDSLTAMSVGHAAMWRDPPLEQRARSWYMLFFQFEDVAEAWLQHEEWRLFRSWMIGAPDVDATIADLSRPGRLTAGLNWYRANLRPRPPGEWMDLPPVKVPTLGIWSDRDFALTEGQMRGSGEFVEAAWRYERIEGAGHWIQHDAPEQLNALLLEHLRANG